MNSTTSAVSSYSSITSAAQTTGYSEFARRSIEDEVLSELRDKEAKRRTRDEIDVDINNAVRDMMNAVLKDVQEDYLSSFDTIDFKSGRTEYPLFDDFRKMTAIWISNGSDYVKAIPMRVSDDLPNISSNSNPSRYYLRDGVIGIRPVPTADITAGAKIWYERRIPSLKNEGDELPFILRDFKRAIVAYALEKASIADDNTQKTAKYSMEFIQGKKDMVETLKDRDVDAVKSIKIVNDGDLYS
jgi:hypothetical protein